MAVVPLEDHYGETEQLRMDMARILQIANGEEVYRQRCEDIAEIAGKYPWPVKVTKS